MTSITHVSDPTAVPNPIESTALSRPQHRVLISDEGHWTAKELRDAVVRSATGLKQAGLTPISRVGLVGPPCAEWVITAHAIGWLGSSVTPLPFDQPSAELEKAAHAAELEFVVVTRGSELSIGEALTDVKVIDGLRMVDLGSQDPEAPPERYWPWQEERAALLTSGTSGTPKPVSLSTAQLVMSAFGSTIRLGHEPHDRWLACLPLSHIGGFSILQRAALCGTTVVLHPRFVATRVAQALDSGEINLVSLVPTMFERILDVRGEVPFPRELRAILLGGAGVSDNLIERARTARAPVALTWGMTETASQICTRFPGDLAPDAGSGPPLPFTRVVHDQGTDTLAVFGPSARGHHQTRDMGRVLTDGNVVITGRRDDTIVSGGENISPVEVEELLQSHDEIRDALVIGIPDVRWGERPIALLVSQTDNPPDPVSFAKDLKEWCKHRLASYKIPERFVWVEAIPRGTLNKKNRRRARELVRSLAPEIFPDEPRDEELQEGPP